MFNIPSAISQSVFADQRGDEVNLSEREINYFYFLMFLYREELSERIPNLFIKIGDKYVLNEKVSYYSKDIEIEMVEFQDYGVVSNHKYDDIRSFINKLSKLSIITNIFGKNINKDIESIKVVDTHSWDKSLLTIKLTKELVELIVHTESYFMKVDLNNLLTLNGKKAKLLYLLLKDYSNSGKKDLRIDKLVFLIGKIPQKMIFDRIIEQINVKTDIMVFYKVTGGIRKKKYKFTVENKPQQSKNKKKSKPTENKKKSEPSEKKEEINLEVMEKAKQQLKLTKKKGNKIDNEDRYLKKIYDNEMAKLAKLAPSDTEMLIKDFIESFKKELEYDKNAREIPYVMIDTASKHERFIDDDCKLISRFRDMYTHTAEETVEEINHILDSGGEVKIKYLPGFVKHLSMSCCLSSKELRIKGWL